MWHFRYHQGSDRALCNRNISWRRTTKHWASVGCQRCLKARKAWLNVTRRGRWLDAVEMMGRPGLDLRGDFNA